MEMHEAILCPCCSQRKVVRELQPGVSGHLMIIKNNTGNFYEAYPDCSDMIAIHDEHCIDMSCGKRTPAFDFHVKADMRSFIYHRDYPPVRECVYLLHHVFSEYIWNDYILYFNPKTLSSRMVFTPDLLKWYFEAP